MLIILIWSLTNERENWDKRNEDNAYIFNNNGLINTSDVSLFNITIIANDRRSRKRNITYYKIHSSRVDSKSMRIRRIPDKTPICIDA